MDTHAHTYAAAYPEIHTRTQTCMTMHIGTHTRTQLNIYRNSHTYAHAYRNTQAYTTNSPHLDHVASSDETPLILTMWKKVVVNVILSISMKNKWIRNKN